MTKREVMTIAEISSISFKVSEKTVWNFIRIADSDGRVGWGEGTLEGRHQEVRDIITRIAPEFIGDKAAPSFESMRARPGFKLDDAAAVSGIDQALRDIEAQKLGRPLADILGDRDRQEGVRLYANINRGTKDRSAEGFAKRAADAVACGFGAIKIAPFDHVRPDQLNTLAGRKLFDEGVQRILAVRDAIGMDVDLMIDCHWRLTEAAASDLLGELRSIQPYWLECPLIEVADNFTSLRNLRARANDAGIRLAGCETLIGLAGFLPFLEARVYDVIMPDIKYVGGVDEMLRVGDAAASRGTACSPHNPSGPVAHAHSLHVSTQLSNFPFLEFQFAESPLFFSIVSGGLPNPVEGRSAIPMGPGIGISLDMVAISHKRVDN